MSYLPGQYVLQTQKQTLMKDLKFNRIKFKPGYQRQWRSARTALKDLLGLKLTYQTQLTRYLVRFFRKTSTSLIKNELNIKVVFIYAGLVPDVTTFNLFFSSNIIFVNGYLPLTKNIVCVPSDLIQIIISK